MELKIEPELKALIPPLTNDEYRLLEESIISEGCRDKLIVWDDTIIDGHNRYEICKKNGIPFQVEDRDFESFDAVKVWMIDNQKGRRNLTDGWKWELAQARKALLADKGKENLKTNIGEGQRLSTIDKGKEHDTRKELATELGWSTGKVAMADKVWKEAKPEMKEQVKSGEVSINQAYSAIKKEQKAEELQKKKTEYTEQSKKEVQNKPIIEITDAVSFLTEFEDGSIDLLITDPPYKTDVDDIHRFTADWLTIAIDKINKGGRAYICSGAYPEEIYAFLNVLLKQSKFNVDSPIIWTYRNTLGVTPKMKYNLNYQVIWHLYSDESPELDTSVTNEMFSVQDINAPDGRQGNRLHKWQKPDELARRIIRHSTKENDLVVDCFSCTGTFLIEAARLGRISHGCEINKEYAKIAEERGCTINGM